MDAIEITPKNGSKGGGKKPAKKLRLPKMLRGRAKMYGLAAGVAIMLVIVTALRKRGGEDPEEPGVESFTMAPPIPPNAYDFSQSGIVPSDPTAPMAIDINAEVERELEKRRMIENQAIDWYEMMKISAESKVRDELQSIIQPMPMPTAPAPAPPAAPPPAPAATATPAKKPAPAPPPAGVRGQVAGGFNRSAIAAGHNYLRVPGKWNNNPVSIDKLTDADVRAAALAKPAILATGWYIQNGSVLWRG